MGAFHHSIQVGAIGEPHTEEVTALVDTGSIYTLIPSPILERLSIPPRWHSTFELADGREVELGLAEVRIILNDQERTTVCVFGPPDTSPCWAP